METGFYLLLVVLVFTAVSYLPTDNSDLAEMELRHGIGTEPRTNCADDSVFVFSHGFLLVDSIAWATSLISYRLTPVG